MKKGISLLLALILLVSLCACGPSGVPAQTTGEAGDPAHSRYPITVTDQAGRQVTIEQEPQRLISSYYITTSLLMALGLDAHLVGVEDNAGLRPVYALSCPEILELPSIGTVKELDLEICAALEPDLAILPMKVKDSVDDLEALGIQVLLVEPESQALLAEMIRLVGEATNTEVQAQELLSFIETQVHYLETTLAEAPRPDVYLAGNSSILTTAGDAMYQSDLIRLAGGKNVAGQIPDTYWAQIDYEQLLVWDPEYIILPSAASYTVADVMADPNLAQCRAVASGKVFQIPGDAEAWDSPVPGSILGALWLAQVLHPELVDETTCSEIMDAYYETFYHFQYSEI